MAVVVLTSEPAAAGEFVINPLRVTLDRTTRATEVVVRNDDKAPLRMQVQAMTWTQSVDGVDQYEPAEGLLYFPRTMEIPPGESRIVRVGVRAAPVTREETYRLFIEELPPASAADEQAQGTSLRVYLRVGVAVFVAPAQPERKGETTRLDIRPGKSHGRSPIAATCIFAPTRLNLPEVRETAAGSSRKRFRSATSWPGRRGPCESTSRPRSADSLPRSRHRSWPSAWT
jgi:hypothetical protein